MTEPELINDNKDPSSTAPATAQEPSGPRRELPVLSWADPWRWLACGWRDMRSAMGIALFYGMCFWGMALSLRAVFLHQPVYTMSLMSGCLLAGPFLAMGLYEVSRQREQGQPPDLGTSLTCWDSHIGSMGLLVLVLLLLELLWGRASLVVFAVFFNTGMPSTAGVLQAVFNPENWAFVAVYAAVGSVFAGLVFATSVVSIPMILDRDTDAISASITSLQVFFGNLPVMIFWGALITALVVLACIPWGLGLLIVGPWLGHATWHAYRGSVRWLD
jgi:uncharacterized membrane protein